MKYLSVIILVLLSLFTKAQEGWSIGVMGSFSHAYQYNTDDWNADPNILVIDYSDVIAPKSFEIGVKSNYYINEWLNVEGQLLFSQQKNSYSNKVDKNSRLVNFSASVKTNHVKLPLLFQVTSNTEYGNYFSFGIGPVFSFLTNYEETFVDYDEDKFNFISTWTRENKKIYYDLIDKDGNLVPEGYRNVDFESDMIYNMFHFGLKAQIGGKIMLGEVAYLELQFYTDYMFTDSENKKAKQVVTYRSDDPDKVGTTSNVYNESIPYKFNRPPDRLGARQATHFLTYGFTIGIGMYIGRY